MRRPLSRLRLAGREVRHAGANGATPLAYGIMPLFALATLAWASRGVTFTPDACRSRGAWGSASSWASR